MDTVIETFWRSNPSYWIAVKNKEAADRDIYEKFSGHNWLNETDLGKVIYLDQFTRHFSRIEKNPGSEAYILACRNLACSIVKGLDLSLYSGDDLVWLLMPFKHLGDYKFVFDSIMKWLDGKKLTDCSSLSKFFNDTYRKCYTFEKISSDIQLVNEDTFVYNPETICDYYPDTYRDDWLLKDSDKLTNLKNMLKKHVVPGCTVSLSGGVDSMVLCALLKLCGIPFNAVHIVYGNREESNAELAFISKYCYRLGVRFQQGWNLAALQPKAANGVPLYTYRIEYLKRSQVDRDFYEEMTREIRFNCYRFLDKPVLLGHIQEDLVENIWTNFAKGTHLDNLGKMEISSTEFVGQNVQQTADSLGSPKESKNGVNIIRPFLHASKSDIYKASEELGIPYLKNTTPSWSNRGKFREKFYEATHEQFGEAVDKKVLEVAERLKGQAALINKLLYEPIYKSWNPEKKSIDITAASKASIDAESWSHILTHICHEFLGISKPTIHACRDFTSRINKLTGIIGVYKYDFKKDMKVTILVDDKDVMLVF
jgi:tRNA(Ile)-lysidine synthase TilS/MesJ